VSSHSAVIVTCDATGCDRVAVAVDDHAVSWETARAWARSWGWTSPHDDGWCPDHTSQYGSHGYARPLRTPPPLTGDDGDDSPNGAHGCEVRADAVKMRYGSRRGPVRSWQHM